MGANGSMLFSVVRIALEELVAHKGSSLLTMLGIVVGVAAVIAMVSLGQGAQEQVQQQIASMGTNMLIVQRGQPEHRRRAVGRRDQHHADAGGRGGDPARSPGRRRGEPECRAPA